MKRMSFPIAVAAACFSAFGLLQGELLAQQTSTGAFGSRTTGGTGGISTARGGTTGRTGGAATSGTAGIGGGSGGSLLQEVTGEATENARYTRNTRAQGGQQFVGADTGDSRAVGLVQAASTSSAAGGRGGQQQFGLLSGNGGLGQLLQGQLNQGNVRQRSSAGGASQIRVPIRMGFDPIPIATTRFTGRFQTRLGKIPALSTRGPIEVLVEGETVVLRGVVASEGDRQLAEDLAKLEPEVFLVRNELTVQEGDGSTAEGLPDPANATP